MPNILNIDNSFNIYLELLYTRKKINYIKKTYDKNNKVSTDLAKYRK